MSRISPPTRRIAEEITALAPSATVHHEGEDYPEAYATGRALSVEADEETTTLVADYVWEHRDRLGLIVQILAERERRTANSSNAWTVLDDGGPAGGAEHLHLFFTGKKVPPLDAPAPASVPESEMPGQDPLPLDDEVDGDEEESSEEQEQEEEES